MALSNLANIPMFRSGYVDCNPRLQPLETHLQAFVKHIFWPHSKASIAEYGSYFKYFQSAISDLTWPDGINYDEQLAMKTYGDLAKVKECMEANRELDRSLIAEELQSEFPGASKGQILRSMDLTARLWLNLHVRSGDYPLGPNVSGLKDIEWMPQASFKKLIQDCFQASNYTANERDKHIDTAFREESPQTLSPQREMDGKPE